MVCFRTDLRGSFATEANNHALTSRLVLCRLPTCRHLSKRPSVRVVVAFIAFATVGSPRASAATASRIFPHSIATRKTRPLRRPRHGFLDKMDGAAEDAGAATVETRTPHDAKGTCASTLRERAREALQGTSLAARGGPGETVPPLAARPEASPYPGNNPRPSVCICVHPWSNLSSDLLDAIRGDHVHRSNSERARRRLSALGSRGLSGVWSLRLLCLFAASLFRAVFLP